MALVAQLQDVWRAQLEKYLLVQPVFADTLCNRNYEADLKKDKNVKIVSVGRITAGALAALTDPWVWGKLDTTNQNFTADQTAEVHQLVEPLDQLGSALNLIDEVSRETALATRLRQDSFIASLHTAIVTNVYGDDANPITVGFDAAAGEILPSVAMTILQQKAAESNANVSVFNTVVPVWLASYLNQELGTRFTSVGDSALAAGVVPGEPLKIAVGGFSKIVPSNNVYNTAGAKYKIMCGNPSQSITFAEALTVSETGKIIEGYGDFVKSLVIYGGKAPFEKAMSLGTFNKGTARQ